MIEHIQGKDACQVSKGWQEFEDFQGPGLASPT